MNPWEYGEAIALHAQAIAVRSYLGWYINNYYISYDNSNSRQVYIPYKFDSMNLSTTPLEPNSTNPCAEEALNSRQRQVCAAVASGFYLARDSNNPDNFPAFTEFTADVKTATRNHPEVNRFPYLAGVIDPISTACDSMDFGANLAGMSQRGANRWVRGHECSKPGAPITQGNAPGGTWSVRWDRVEQILFHYYTGVNLRNSVGERLSPDYRWNPLSITGFPSSPVSGQTYNISAQIQNVGVKDLTCAPPFVNFTLRYRWWKEGNTETVEVETVSLCGLQKGSSLTANSLNLQIPNWGSGAYYSRFDIYVQSLYSTPSFWFSEQNWPSFNVSVCVDGPCELFLPIMFVN